MSIMKNFAMSVCMSVSVNYGQLVEFLTDPV